jgi:5-formyltetrahydrofolate cyclo-ligase
LLQKSDLRSRFFAAVKDLTDEYRAGCSRLVCEQLHFLSPSCVGGYSALSSEIDLKGFLETQKHCYLPRFNGQVYEWVCVDSFDQCVLGPHGVWEPPDTLEVCHIAPDVVLVPGVAFDRFGNRLGRGGGYYDRLLSGTACLKIGVAFDEQISRDVLPVEAHDIRMDALVTPTYFRYF